MLFIPTINNPSTYREWEAAIREFGLIETVPSAHGGPTVAREFFITLKGKAQNAKEVRRFLQHILKMFHAVLGQTADGSDLQTPVIEAVPLPLIEIGVNFGKLACTKKGV
ncbi:MAG: hypothetical protein IJ722_07735 [Alloprevotella sp.]|nr:hypothetical protein [Alloprevotella sp.]